MEKNQEKELEKDFSKKIKISEKKLLKKTLNMIILGMAGSGKTTFVQKMEEIIAERDKESYIINLDPAVMDTLYEPNMDIRDTIKYKK